MRVEAYREALLSEVLPRWESKEPLARDLLRWMGEENPAGGLYGAIARDEDANILGVRLAMDAPVTHKGTPLPAAQLVSRLADVDSLSQQQDRTLAHALLSELEARGVQLVFALPSEAWPRPLLEELGFSSPFEMISRNLYLDYNPFSSDTGSPRFTPVRKVAKLARRLRQKLLEIQFEETWLGYAQRLFEQREAELDLAMRRDARYIAWRYAEHPERKYRMLILRRKAGVGLDAFVVMRPVSPGGRKYLQVVDHWTRIGERRSTAWLLGELAMLGLAEEEASAIQAIAPTGSPLEQALIASGCIRKKEQHPLMIKLLGDEPAVDVRLETGRVQLRAGDFELF